jgi:RNA ligase (TIGR02306 family)
MPLASIQEVVEVAPIPGADLIERVRVLGWDVVCKKGEFFPGSLCVYIEIDSLLPRKEWSEFLFKHPEDTEYRLRTIKLRKQVSQGLVLPLSILPLGLFETGYDVTEQLEIKKYEKAIPVQLRGTVKGKFPYFLHKTDEVRIQSAPELLEELSGKPYYITQKLDGTSSTFFKWKGKFGVCSRNLEMKNPYDNPKERFKYIWDAVKRFFGIVRQKENPRTFNLNVYWKMAEKYNIKEWLPDGWAIQAEICGPSIQGNKMGLKENEMFIFNLWNIDEQKYYYPRDVLSDFTKWSSNDTVKLVPLFETGQSFPNETIEGLLELARGEYDNDTPQEGIVLRAIDQSVSFKVVNNEFLLKYSE